MAGSPSPLPSIPVGNGPQPAVYDSVDGHVYVSDSGLSVISPLNDSVVTTISIGQDPLEPAVDTSNGNLFVPEEAVVGAPPRVTVVSSTTEKLLANITFTDNPDTPVYDAGNGNLYLSFDQFLPSPGQDIGVINGSNDSLVKLIDLKENVTDPTYDPATGDIFVLAVDNASVAVLSGLSESLVAQLAVGFAPLGVSYDTDNGNLYVVGLSGTGDTQMAVISGATDTVVKVVTLYGATGSAATFRPGQPVFDQAAKELFVPVGVSYCQGGLGSYGCNWGGSLVFAVSPGTYSLDKEIRVGVLPTSPVVDPLDGDLYTSNSGSCNVSVINGSNDSIVATIHVGVAPFAPAYGAGSLFVANDGSSNVSVINGSVPSSLGFGGGCTSLGPGGFVMLPWIVLGVGVTGIVGLVLWARGRPIFR